MATPFPFVASAVLTAAQLNSIGERITYTPAVISVSGTITTVGAVSCNYIRVQNLVVVEFNITITTIGTAGGGIVFDLPLTANTNLMGAGVGRESLSAAPLFVWHSTTQAQIQKYDGTFSGGNGYQFVGILTYGAA